MYVFGMFYCGDIAVGNGQIIEINGGSGRPIWITWKDNNGIVVNRYSCSLLEKSSAFLKVRIRLPKKLRFLFILFFFPYNLTIRKHITFIYLLGSPSSSKHRMFDGLSLAYLNGYF